MIGDTTYEYTLALELPEGFRELRVLEEKLAVAGNPIYSREVAEFSKQSLLRMQWRGFW